jgi:dTDP-4-dehydrorhamnose 3,5-epimerase
VIRALHYQLRFPQGKLIIPIIGEIWDVVVDVRRRSPTFGKWLTVTLTANSCCQLYVPPGFAHGFAVDSDAATVLYKCTDFYHPEDEYGIIWNDPDLMIPWPVTTTLLSDKDQVYPKLRDLQPNQLPLYE